MSFSSLAFQRGIVSLTAIFLVSACSENGREAPLSKVETIDIPVADIDNQTNQNIANPTLEIPATFQVNDGDLLTLVWSDEFDGATLDPEVWFYESGDGTQYGIPFPSWGNNELQYYLPDNVQLANGALQVTARRESAEGFNFTSGRVMTRDRFAFKYGRIEASIKLPSGQGLWPAFWMLPQDDEPDAAPGKGIYGVYAQSGEIDIVEAINLDANPTPSGRGGGNEIFSTIHFGGDSSVNQNLRSETLYTPSFDVTADFHTYAFEWDEFEMRWYADGTLYKVENSWSSAGGAYPAPFDEPFYVLFNLAVGGSFPGSPDGSTPSPATMEVDWIRVYSGEAPPVTPADPGIIPDDVIYASDPGETVDLVATVSAFGTTSQFDGAYDQDADFNPAFEVVSGTGYGIPHIAQLGLIDLPAGFATGYESFSFKIKSANLPGNLITVKLQNGGAYGNVVLTDTTVSTPLGNGWYQVVLPMSGFANIDPAVGVVFEAQDQVTGFSFLVTDIGFNSGAPVGADPGIIPDDVMYATDPGETVDLVATVAAFGTTSQFNATYALDADFNPAFEVVSGTGYGIPHIAQLGLIDLPAGFATGYESFVFKIKSADLPGNLITVKLQGGGEYGNVVLTDTTVSTALGNGWYQVVLPMSSFTNVAPAVGVVFEAQDQNTGFSFLLTDIGFNNPAGGGGGSGVIPDDVIYATDPGEVIDLVATISAFGTTSQFDAAYALDADFNPAFEVVSGTGYGIPHIAQLGLVGLPAGFATGYESFSFKIKSADLPGNLITVKLEQGGAYGNVVLTDTTVSTALGNGWYQVVLPMSGFANIDPAVGVVFEAQDQNTGFSFLLTDIGFSGTGGGGGGTCPPVGAELATNGDFEAGDLSCWEGITNGGTITADNTQNNTMGGTWSAHVVTAGASNPTLKQNFLAEGTVQIGDVIDISFDMKGTAGAGGVIFPKLISEGAGGSDGPILETIAVPNANWQTYTYSPTITADVARGITFEISVVCGAVAGCTADVFIDNVSVTIR
jgi:beta-glucanase (GH16 family)